MKNIKIIVAGAAAVVVVAGAAVYQKLDSWLPDEPTGPGSGDELIEYDGEPTPNWPDGPGSGDELEGPGPGSGDELIEYDGEPTPNWPDGPGSGDEIIDSDYPPTPNWPDGPGSGEELEWTGPGSGEELDIKGSCNTIDNSSICVEYIGTYYSREENMRMHCAGAGIFSTGACPRPFAGACRMNADTANELFMYHYNYGGDPYTAEVVPYAAMACNANPAGQWYDGN